MTKHARFKNPYEQRHRCVKILTSVRRIALFRRKGETDRMRRTEPYQPSPEASASMSAGVDLT